jgi:hypothetical protein
MIRDADQEARGPRAESSPVDSTPGSAPFSSAETVVSRHSTAHGTKRCANNHKKPTKSLAIPVSTKTALIDTPARVETLRGTLGSIVVKLFEAMNEEKQVGTSDAAANSRNITGANTPTLAMLAV